MQSDKFKFGKMLKLIVASEFPKWKGMSFTGLILVPIIVFLGGTFTLILGEIDTNYATRFVLLLIITTLFVFAHQVLKSRSEKWRYENKHTIQKHKKKIFYHFLIYVSIYWGVAIGFLLILANS